MLTITSDGFAFRQIVPGAIKSGGHLFTERGLQAAAARTTPAVLRPEGRVPMPNDRHF
jgi:hypothetical protein